MPVPKLGSAYGGPGSTCGHFQILSHLSPLLNSCLSSQSYYNKGKKPKLSDSLLPSCPYQWNSCFNCQHQLSIIWLYKTLSNYILSIYLIITFLK